MQDQNQQGVQQQAPPMGQQQMQPDQDSWSGMAGGWDPQRMAWRAMTPKPGGEPSAHH